MTLMKDLPVGLQALLRRLKTYDVTWNFDFIPAEDEQYEVGTDREEADLDKANVVSSQIRRPESLDQVTGPRHMVAIDLDVPAYLVPSTTPGNSHLYIEVPSGIEHETYMRLLDVLAEANVIETGYADVSKARGHSDLRLPWVKKGEPTGCRQCASNVKPAAKPGEPLPEGVLPF